MMEGAREAPNDVSAFARFQACKPDRVFLKIEVVPWQRLNLRWTLILIKAP
jgi:hypothetical protein